VKQDRKIDIPAGKGPKGPRLRLPYVALLLLALASMALLLPLREITLSFAPGVAFLATLVLFLLPGAVAVGLVPGPALDFPARVPVAFAVSAGVFGLLGLSFLVRKWTLEEYLLVCASVTLLSVAGLILLSLRRPRPERGAMEADKGGSLLWIPLGVLATALSLVSPLVNHPSTWDAWSYLMYIQKFLHIEPLNGFLESPFGRSSLAGWLLEQAALSRISGMDPVKLYFEYLGPLMVFVSVLAFYALARTLFESEAAALVACCVAATILFLGMGPSLEDPGTQFVGRAIEDKFVVRYVFLPVGLTLAALFVKERRPIYLGLFALVCLSVIGIHPVGLIIIAIGVGGFGFSHLILSPLDWRSWLRFGALVAVMLAIVLPLIYLLSLAGELTLPSETALDATRSLWDLKQDREFLTIFGEVPLLYYRTHIVSIPVLAAYVLGVPFLLLQARRSLTARLLLGVLLLTPVLLYAPPVSEMVAGVVGFWRMWRLAWPIHLAALLTLGWMAWWVIELTKARLAATGWGRRLAPLVPLVLVLTLMAVATPRALDGIRSASGVGETSQTKSTCHDPVFSWIGENVEPSAMLLSPDKDVLCVQAYAPLRFVTLRGAGVARGTAVLNDSGGTEAEVPQNVADERKFFGEAVVDAEMLQILRRYEVDYILLPVYSPLNGQLSHLSGFSRLNNPGERYRLYEVDRAGLQETQVVAANSLLNDGKPDAALEVYAAVGGSEDEQFLAHLGTGRAYSEKGLHALAAYSYGRARQLFPQDLTTHLLFAKAYTKGGDKAAARETLRRAVSLSPEHAELRLRLGESLLKRDPDEAAEQMRAAVELSPEVPSYRIQLGEALLRADRSAAAESELEYAIHLNPLLPDVHVQVAEAFAAARRPEEAISHYEEALRLTESTVEVRRLELGLGLVYSRLSKDESSYAEEARAHLEEAAKPGRENSKIEHVRGGAYLALGNLHRREGRPKAAIAAYERAIELLGSDSKRDRATKKLKKLQENVGRKR
jgi:tetratricopeptide (TPR) repeat protein